MAGGRLDLNEFAQDFPLEEDGFPALPIAQQCRLLAVSRSAVYRKPVEVSAEDLGGGPSLLDPFPERPPRMHRLTYYRLSAKAMAAQERSIALGLEYLRRHYPGVLRDENVVGA